MALFPNTVANTVYNGLVGKTHTNLVVSEGDAPAERLVVSKTNASDSFIYEYGPEGNQNVLIAKGKIVEACAPEYDSNIGFTSTAIKVADEDSAYVIGVNHHNVYDQRRDAMEGNRPTVITRNLIEVPLFEHANVATAAATAKAMHFGAAYGDIDEIRPGDYVVAGVDGNFKRYVSGTNTPEQIVGQVWGATRELAPAGFLQYYTGLKDTYLEDYIKQISATPAQGDDDYPYGAPYTVGSWKPEFLKNIAGGNLTGIPFLTDGYFSAKETIIKTIDKVANALYIENVILGGATDSAIAGATLTVAAGEKVAVFVKMVHPFDIRGTENLSVTYKDALDVVKTVSTRDVHMDIQNNTIVIYFDDAAVYKDITVTVDAVVNPTAGIPTGWDFKGSVGAVRILLQK